MYEAVAEWERLPHGWSYPEVAGVAADSHDRIHVLTRGEHPVIVFDQDGTFVRSWGEGVLGRAHGIFIDDEDVVYISDNTDHTVRIFDPDGVLRQTLGTPGVPRDSGFVPWTVPVQRSVGPFNGVTNLARHGGGDLFVADGYGNASVHVYRPDGTHLGSWGEPGTGPGQFRLPHGIAIDSRGEVYVADRENSRIQILDRDGHYVREITDVLRPDAVFIDADDQLYVAELGFVAGILPNGLGATPPPDPKPGGRVTVMSSEGEVRARIDGRSPGSPDGFIAPHGICVDSTGAIYVGEVCESALQNYGGGEPDIALPTVYRALHKFVPTGRVAG